MNSLIKAMLSVDRRSKSVDSNRSQSVKISRNLQSKNMAKNPSTSEICSTSSTNSIVATANSSGCMSTSLSNVEPTTDGKSIHFNSKSNSTWTNTRYLQIPRIECTKVNSKSFESVVDDYLTDEGQELSPLVRDKPKAAKSDTDLEATTCRSPGAAATRFFRFSKLSSKIKKKFNANKQSSAASSANSNRNSNADSSDSNIKSNDSTPKIKLFKSPSLDSLTLINTCDAEDQFYSLSTSDISKTEKKPTNSNENKKIPIIQVDLTRMVIIILSTF